jgi:hypothetical protein
MNDCEPRYDFLGYFIIAIGTALTGMVIYLWNSTNEKINSANQNPITVTQTQAPININITNPIQHERQPIVNTVYKTNTVYKPVLANNCPRYHKPRNHCKGR